MRNPFVRLAALGVAVIAVWSCDTGPAAPRFGNGIQGGPTGTAPITPPNPSAPDTNRPFTRIDTPSVGQLVNVGDSILTVVRINDDRQIASLTLTGYDYSGDPNLGTFQRNIRYAQVVVPTGTNFRAGLVDTTVRRYLKPAIPLDTTVDSLVIEAISRDAAGNADTLLRRVNIVTGPKLSIVAPPSGDSVPQGFGMVVRVRAEHSDGVASMVIRAQHPGTWPTRMTPDSFIVVFSSTSPVRDTIHAVTFNVPSDATLRSIISISASAVDVNRNPGSTPPLNVTVRAAGSLPPRVYQVVPGRVEFGDSIQVTAMGDGITQIGLILRDTAGNVIPGGDTVTFGAPFSSNVVQKLALNLGLVDQGTRIGVQSFAVDANTTPRIGYSIQTGTTTPVTVASSAFTDTSFVAFGRTYALPRNGVAGDVAVDVLRGNVFVSNTNFNLVEVWNNGTKTFTPTGVPVGALPWGLFVSNNPDTLLVANSGATTVSRVCIGNCATGIREDLARRIRTRNTTIFQVNWTRDEVTGKIKISRLPDVSYSDRPQYIAQSAGGRLFFSTRPTPSAPDGTLRWLDPAYLTPDPRQVWQYGRIIGGDATTYAIFHADSIRIGVTPNSSPIADTLYIFDHVYGGTAPIIVSDSLPVRAANNIVLNGGDVEAVLNLDVNSLALTDTTFVASSGDRNWVGFGEGATAGTTGRLTMVNDPPGVAPIFFSPGITVTDLVHNANERIFGMAVDSTGLQVVAHGLQTYVAAMDNPFHMRLDGVYDSFDNGAGVAFHPRANGTNTADPNNRVLFTATASGVIEIVDIAHYNNRGRLVTKGNFYGPLRATVPLPGDAAAGVILKLYGLSDQGLVVIDLRASDIRPAP